MTTPSRRSAPWRETLRACALAFALTLVACGASDKDLTEAELAKRIESEIPPGPDRPPVVRRAAAAALARDITELAKDAEALGVTDAAQAEEDARRTAIIARECEDLAATIAALKRLADPSATGEQLAAEERAALPAEIARNEARYASLCR